MSLAFHTPTYSHWWYLDFAAPGNQFVTTGTVAGARDSRSRPRISPDSTCPAMGAADNTLTTTFEVKEIKYGTAGAVTSFWATFEQHCEGAVPAARGEIRYNVTGTP